MTWRLITRSSGACFFTRISGNCDLGQVVNKGRTSQRDEAACGSGSSCFESRQLMKPKHSPPSGSHKGAVDSDKA
jgi:hypothetical protein